VALAREDRPDRRCDIAGREARGRNLIEQRLKEVIIVAIDDRHVERRVGKPLGGGEPAEAGADDHDARESRTVRAHFSISSQTKFSSGSEPQPDGRRKYRSAIDPIAAGTKADS